LSTCHVGSPVSLSPCQGMWHVMTNIPLIRHAEEWRAPEVAQAPQPAPAPSAEALRHLRAALSRIRSHIGKPAKLEKAAGLFCKLLAEGNITAHVADEAFQAQTLPTCSFARTGMQCTLLLSPPRSVPDTLFVGWPCQPWGPSCAYAL
jgi:hypothetical protein